MLLISILMRRSLRVTQAQRILSIKSARALSFGHQTPLKLLIIYCKSTGLKVIGGTIQNDQFTNLLETGRIKRTGPDSLSLQSITQGYRLSQSRNVRITFIERKKHNLLVSSPSVLSKFGRLPWS